MFQCEKKECVIMFSLTVGSCEYVILCSSVHVSVYLDSSPERTTTLTRTINSRWFIMADALRPNAHVDVTCVCNENERETEERGVQVGEYEGVRSVKGAMIHGEGGRHHTFRVSCEPNIYPGLPYYL